MITLNQYILLDPILLFFVSGSAMGMVKIRNSRNESFSSKWWFWLVFTGTMLAGAISVKFVGLFVVLLVGLYTIMELWEILGDLSLPVFVTVKHFMARALGLILLPAVLYMSYFYIHLLVLNRSGSGDGFYSSAFQSKLIGNSLYNASMPREVAYGAILTFKNRRTGGGYLHSHWHLYPEGVGARQQQITTYTHKDDNNKWLIKPYYELEELGDEIKFVRSGDLVRLEHIATRRNLHSHQENAPLTKKHLQVTGYGENGTGDANDVWKVIVDGGDDDRTVKTVTSQVKFIHYLQHCALTTTSKQLPKWAYEQQEVTCNPNTRDKNAYWNVEDNFFPKLPNVSFEVYAPGFIERFFESHAVMLQGNAGLKPKEGEVTSRPWQWPLNYRGQFFSGNSYRIYLLGNPVIWWGNLVFLPLALLLMLYDSVREKRSGVDKSGSGYRKRMAEASLWLFIGWLLHYVPFWGMGRVLYFHHYFPALYFSSMMSGVTLDYFLRGLLGILPERLSKVVFHWAMGVLFSGVIYSFYLFSPLAYGMIPKENETYSEMQNLKWLDSWEF
ncbi:UNVERIFIED_CONTAM: hypothetical protein PYX00_007222 [Menopon gallinae]